MKELEKVKDIFLSDVDEETRNENLEKITEWEMSLAESNAFAEWQAHDISKQIIEKLKDSYVEQAVTLATNRSVTEADRQSLWAKQDACLWLLSLIAKDVEADINYINGEIQRALNVT